MGECRQTFQGMLPNILGNVAKHFGECPQTFRGMLLNIPGNVAKYQPESVIIHAGTHDLTNGINMLNNAKKIVKELTTKLPKVKIAFSGLIARKDKKNLDKNVTETNKRLKNYCRQKDIGYIDNSNITEDSYQDSGYPIEKIYRRRVEDYLLM